jgi:hypothetical protein
LGLTNDTACVDGFFNGWKDWCSPNAKECIQNFVLGDFPEMILNNHKQYIAGKEAAPDEYSVCPAGNLSGWKQVGYSEHPDMERMSNTWGPFYFLSVIQKIMNSKNVR